MATISEEKIAVLIRLREMLQRQRDKFQTYLALLEQEQASIMSGDTEKLLAQVELERTIIAEIFTLKKVIAPLQDLYQATYPERESTVPLITSTLDRMGQEIIDHNARNRCLLKEKMEEMRGEIASLRAWPKASSAFTEPAPSFIDITT